MKLQWGTGGFWTPTPTLLALCEAKGIEGTVWIKEGKGKRCTVGRFCWVFVQWQSECWRSGLWVVFGHIRMKSVSFAVPKQWKMRHDKAQTCFFPIQLPHYDICKLLIYVWTMCTIYYYGPILQNTPKQPLASTYVRLHWDSYLMGFGKFDHGPLWHGHDSHAGHRGSTDRFSWWCARINQSGTVFWCFLVFVVAKPPVDSILRQSSASFVTALTPTVAVLCGFPIWYSVKWIVYVSS